MFFQLSRGPFMRNCLKRVRSCMKATGKCGLDDLINIKVRYELSDKL